MIAEPSISDRDRIKSSLISSSQKPAELLPPLREFEVAFIARYLSAAQKLTRMALLNRRWRELLNKHFTQSKLPSPGPLTLIGDYQFFLKEFSQFTGVEIPELSTAILKSESLESVKSCHSIGKITVDSEEAFHLITTEYPIILRKIRHLTLDFKINCIERVNRIFRSSQFWQSLTQLESLNLCFYASPQTDADELDQFQISLQSLCHLRKLQACCLGPFKELIKITDLPSSMIHIQWLQDISPISIQEIGGLPLVESLQCNLQINEATQLNPNLKYLKLNYGESILCLSPLRNLISLGVFNFAYQGFELVDLPHLQSVKIGLIQSYDPVSMQNLPALTTIVLNIHCLKLQEPLRDRKIAITPYKFQLNGVSFSLERAQDPLFDNLFIYQDLSLNVWKEEHLPLLKERTNSCEILNVGSQITHIDIELPLVEHLYIDLFDDNKIPVDTVSMKLLSPKLSYVNIHFIDQSVNFELSQKLQTLEIKCVGLQISGSGYANMLVLDTDRRICISNENILESVKQMTLDDISSIYHSLLSMNQISYDELRKLTLRNFNASMMKALFIKAPRLIELVLENDDSNQYVIVPYSKSLKVLDISNLKHFTVLIEKGKNTGDLIILNEWQEPNKVKWVND